MHHDCLVLLGHTVESLLHNMTSESIHAEIESIAADSLGNLNDLLRSAVLKAALYQEIAKAIDHERVGLLDDSLYDLELGLGHANFELLLQED